MDRYTKALFVNGIEMPIVKFQSLCGWARPDIQYRFELNRLVGSVDENGNRFSHWVCSVETYKLENLKSNSSVACFNNALGGWEVSMPRMWASDAECILGKFRSTILEIKREYPELNIPMF